MFALDLFNTKYEKALREGAVDKVVSEGGPYDLPGKDYPRPGDAPRKPRPSGSSTPRRHPDDPDFMDPDQRRLRADQERVRKANAEYHAKKGVAKGDAINENSDVLAGLTDILKIAASRQTPQNPRYFAQQVKDVALQLKDNPATQKWSSYLDGVIRWADVISSGKEQYSSGFANEVHSVLGPATRAYQDALLNKPGVGEGNGRDLTNTPRDQFISRMTPSMDANALRQKVAKIVNSPGFTEDTILQIVDAGDNLSHPAGRYIQQAFYGLQYNLGKEYEDYPERVAEKLLLQFRSMLPAYRVAEATTDMPFGGISLNYTGDPSDKPQQYHYSTEPKQSDKEKRQQRLLDVRSRKQDLLSDYAQLGALRVEMIYGINNDVFLNKEQLLDYFDHLVDDPALTPLEYAHENGIPIDGLLKGMLRRAAQLGIGALDVRKLWNSAKDKVKAKPGVAESTGRAVNDKGLTQQQWLQLVQTKFPDAKIVQAKMIDGPCRATLPDGRTLSWTKVDQGVAEERKPYGDYKQSPRAFGAGNFQRIVRANMGNLPTVTLEFADPNDNIVLDRKGVDLISDYYDGLTTDAIKNHFIYRVLPSADEVLTVLKKLGWNQAVQPELPGIPRQGELPLQEKKKFNSNSDVAAGDVKVARELQKLRAQYPAAKSDVEAVAKAEIDSTDRSQQQLSAIKGANTEQDRLLKQLVALDKKQGTEIGSLDNENDRLEQQLAQVEKTNANLAQAIDQMGEPAQDRNTDTGQPRAINLIPNAPADAPSQTQAQPTAAATAEPENTMQKSRPKSNVMSRMAQDLGQTRKVQGVGSGPAPSIRGVTDLDQYRANAVKRAQAAIADKNFAPLANQLVNKGVVTRTGTDEAVNEEQRLQQGDPVVVTAPNEFEGKTGEIYELSPSGKFVIVNLYNHGKHSMHLSDVAYNDHADQEEANDWYDEGVAEGKKKRKKKSSRSMGGYFFPGYAYYGGDSGEGGGDGGGESVNEFAPAGGGGSGNYFQALASAWYNGTFNTGSLQKGIKSKEDVERLLNRGIVCPDGKTRKLHIDYNSDFDGVEIYSDDYYEHGDYDDTIDSRTGQKWGPYDFMAFSDEDLSEGVAEGGRRYDDNRTGFGKRPREDDEYHVADPAETQYNIKVNGRAINQQPFANRAAALAWAKQAVAAGKLDPKTATLSPINQVNELSTDKLAQYKTAAALDAGAADKRGDYERGDKRFSGIVKATKKQFANDAKKHKDQGVKEGLMKEPTTRKEYLDQRDKLFRMMAVDSNPANKQIIKQALQDLEARYGKIKDPVREESSTASEAVERAILNRIMVAHTDLLMQFGPDKVMQAAEEVAYNVGDVDEIGTSDVSAYVNQVRQILGA